jgi:hypothetical protein
MIVRQHYCMMQAVVSTARHVLCHGGCRWTSKGPPDWTIPDGAAGARPRHGEDHGSELRSPAQTASPALAGGPSDRSVQRRYRRRIRGAALQLLRDDKSACLVSMQRVCGKLGGREGSFVNQGSEIIENGNITAKWLVEGEFSKGSDGMLDYWFE